MCVCVNVSFLSLGNYKLPLCLFSVLFDEWRHSIIHYEKNEKWITLNSVLVAQ